VGFFSAIFGSRTTLGIIVGIIGILIIIAAWSWSGKRSKGQRDVEEKILTMKGELSLLEKER
jgi:H+/gluconate symporter-like permease